MPSCCRHFMLWFYSFFIEVHHDEFLGYNTKEYQENEARNIEEKHTRMQRKIDDKEERIIYLRKKMKYVMTVSTTTCEDINDIHEEIMKLEKEILCHKTMGRFFGFR